MWMILEASGTAAPPVTVVAQQTEDFVTAMSAAAERHDLSVSAILPPGATYGQALERAIRESTTPFLVVIGNPATVLDDEFALRIKHATDLVVGRELIAIVTGNGVDQWGNAFSGIYSSLQPQIPFCRTPIAVVDSASDLFIISRTHVETLLLHDKLPPFENFAGWAVLEGYLGGLVSLFSPHLAVAINGALLAREIEDHATELDARLGARLSPTKIASLDGAIQIGRESAPARESRLLEKVDLEKAIREIILGHCVRMSLSIVTRTQFSRPHLLRRLLTSISRWRNEAVDMEIVLSTDIEELNAEEELAALQREFPALDLRLAWNGDRTEKSRVRNLLGGLAAARKDYVAFIDDDDSLHFQILSHLSTTRFLGAMPIIFVDTELRDEKWTEASDGRWILESTLFHRHYPGSGWRNIFNGVNQLPVCSAVLPRAWAAETLERLQFRHDYSEDFTMWLLLLESSNLPLIIDLPRLFCVVSIRDDGTNTVTENDRSRWARDISLFLHDLHILHPQHGEGRLQSAIGGKANPGALDRPKDLVVSRLRRELALCRVENDHLRSALTGSVIKPAASALA